MPWCPKCRCEYRNDFKACGECGTELVSELPPEEGNQEDGVNVDEHDELVLLISVSNDFEAKLIEAELAAFEVPSFKEIKGIDGIYGFSLAGVDIFVPSHKIDEARDIINNRQE